MENVELIITMFDVKNELDIKKIEFSIQMLSWHKQCQLSNAFGAGVYLSWKEGRWLRPEAQKKLDDINDRFNGAIEECEARIKELSSKS